MSRKIGHLLTAGGRVLWSVLWLCCGPCRPSDSILEHADVDCSGHGSRLRRQSPSWVPNVDARRTKLQLPGSVHRRCSPVLSLETGHDCLRPSWTRERGSYRDARYIDVEKYRGINVILLYTVGLLKPRYIVWRLIDFPPNTIYWVSCTHLYETKDNAYHAYTFVV